MSAREARDPNAAAALLSVAQAALQHARLDAMSIESQALKSARRQIEARELAAARASLDAARAAAPEDAAIAALEAALVKARTAADAAYREHRQIARDPDGWRRERDLAAAFQKATELCVDWADDGRGARPRRRCSVCHRQVRGEPGRRRALLPQRRQSRRRVREREPGRDGAARDRAHRAADAGLRRVAVRAGQPLAGRAGDLSPGHGRRVAARGDRRRRAAEGAVQLPRPRRAGQGRGAARGDVRSLEHVGSHHVGNARELVRDGDGFAARGGAYTTSLTECDASMSQPHDGSADSTTGLRLVREVR